MKKINYLLSKELFKTSYICFILVTLFCSNVFCTSSLQQSWVQTENPNNGNDNAKSVALDSTGIYVACTYSFGPNTAQYLEKRNLSTGSIIWTQVTSTGSPQPADVAVDTSGVYIVGIDNNAGNAQWRIEKRSLSDGSAIWVQTTNPGGASGATSIAVDASGIYITGYDQSPGNQQWRIEKRSLSDGTTIWTQTINPSGSNDYPYSVAVDTTGIYIAGYDSIPGNYQWRVEKRSLSNGSIIWTQTNNPSSGNDSPSGIVLDTTAIYIVGYDNYPGNYQWRIEKRSLYDGTTIWAQTENPSSDVDVAYSIGVDSTGIYIAGYDSIPGNYQWRVEKRSLSDGTTICTQTENLSSGNDYPYSITGNATGIYVVGTDVSPGNMQWRIEKYVEQLSVPTTFVGTTLSAATINWSWINNSSIDELGYKIKTSTDGLIAFLSANTTYWSELGLLPNTQYTRYCNAYNQLVESGNSNSYSKYTFANSPTGLNSTAIYITSSTIQWTNAGATRYSVERAADNNGSPESYVAIKAWADNITGTTYADTGLSAETTYWYRMKSYNGDQIINSTPSNEISLLTLPLAPSVFYGSSQSTGSILWQWTDNSNYEKGFRVKTSTDGMIASLIPNATNWSEPYLLANTQYTRYVVTFNTTGESNKSASSATFSLASSPTGLISGAVYTTSATISWNNVGATRYAIERAPNAGGIPGVWSSIKTWADAITSNNFTDTALSGDTTFWYRIKSYNGNGMINTIPGNEIKIVTLPGPPSGFNGIALSSFSINWSWNDNSNSESGFRIYSSTDGIVGTVSANTTYFIEKNLSTNSQYTRYVIAYNASGNTGASNGDTKYTLANSSIVLNTVLVSISSVTLQWNSVGATRYAIERATDNVGVPGNWAMIKSWADNITGTICIDSNLAGGTTYWYRLKGYNVDGIINDTPSNEMKVYYPSAALDHYEVIAPSYILPNQLFTLTVNAKNESNMTVTNYSGNATIFSVLAENDTIIGSGQLSITSISLTNGAGVLYVETYNKSETIKIKIIDSNGKTGLSGVLNVVSSGTVLYTLTTNSNPLVGGTISPNPFGSVFPSSTSVQLTATPNPGYVFSVWSGDVSGNTNPITVIMNTNKTITAIFTAASSVTPSKIELTANPQSVIAGQSSNITCKVTDVYNNPVSGVPVTFSVTKGSGSVTVSSGNTDTNGQITTIFTHNLTQPGITVVRATAGSLTQDISISAAVLVTAGVQGIIAASEDPNTRVTIPANAISSNIKVTIILKNDLDSGELTMVNAANGKVAGKILPDVVRKFVALKQSDGTDYGNFAKPVTIEIPYTDSDNNGIVDGTQINVNKLKVLRLNETAQEWYLVQDGSLNQVDKVNKIVKCEVNHFSYYTLGNLSVAGDIDTVKPAQLHFGAANAVRKKINELKEKIDLSQ